MEFQPRSIALPSGPMLTPVEFKTFGRSMNTIFEATMPTRAPAIRTSSASHSGSTRVSLFSVPMNAHSGSRSASRTPAFVPRAKWRFSGSGTRVTSGNSSRTMSREPSVLALSTTTTGYVGYVWCRTDWRLCRMESRPFQFRMTTWQMAAMPPRYAPGRLEGDVDQRHADVSSGTISFFASDGIPGRGDGRGRIDGPSETNLVNAAVVDNGGVHVVEAAMCPLCGASGRVRYGQLRDRSWGAPGTWSFRECVACSHLWLDPCPIAEEIGRPYASYYTHGVERRSPLKGNGFWTRCRRGVLDSYGYRGLAHDSTERFLGQAMRFVPPVWEECEETVHSVPGPPRGLLLDIGCGDGYFLRIMRDLGWTVQGLEPDPKAAAFARAYGLDIIQSPIERASLPSNAFDVITTSHVVEHVLEPVTFLSVARRALRPDGLLYVFTPNAESWGHAIFGPSWYPLEPPRHLHIFRPRNLVACAKRAGLQVVDVRTTGRLHLFFDASVSIHKTGQYRFDDPTIHASVFDRLFRVTENLLVHVHPYAGEEIVMRCTNAARG